MKSLNSARPSTASVFSVRPSTRQRGIVVALSLAASLVGGSALAQAANVASPKSDTADEVAKRTVQKRTASAAKFGDRREKRAASLVGSSALAQNINTPNPKSGSADKVARSKTKEIAPFAKFENLRIKGMWVSIPGPADTVDQDKGGFRSALADVGIGYVGWTQNSFANNLLPNAARSTIANQLYNGQNPTFNTVNYLWVTYDLSRFGIPDGQIIVGTEQQSWTWQPGGPDRWGISTMAYYQTFFDRKVELKLGYLANQNEFAGTLVGGNAGANVFGPSSNILYQGGMSNNPAPTPAIDLKYNFDERLYNRATIQRSLSPDGQFTQVTQNPTGLDWSTPNAGLLLLDEAGYRTKAAAGSPDTWLRSGVGFNNSHYVNLANPTQPRVDQNSFYYVAADRQLWQTDVQGTASRGIYGGFSVMGAPPDRNKVSQYYELRVYAKGLFDSRPKDQIAIVATDTVWSNFAVAAAAAKGSLVHRDSKAISGTYTAHLAPGIYLNLGVSYIDHPTSITYTPQTGHALNFSASTAVFF
ncbi:carbohydrate porin [Bradyrhizobium erythrophlei]|uniref:carbohydrate porin n=1 Tax=Bradyrhizobium erythrophlei TaxID=1437360 RepID=UPI0035E84500